MVLIQSHHKTPRYLKINVFHDGTWSVDWTERQDEALQLARQEDAVTVWAMVKGVAPSWEDEDA